MTEAGFYFSHFILPGRTTDSYKNSYNDSTLYGGMMVQKKICLALVHAAVRHEGGHGISQLQEKEAELSVFLFKKTVMYRIAV